VPLADIDRIEVIRGPGATVWGANAVNGVISIITKSSKDTQGGLLEGAGGTYLLEQSLVQYGGSVGQSHYRFFVDSTANRNNAGLNGLPSNDDSHNVHGGFRADWDVSGKDLLTVEGDLDSSSGWLTYSGFVSLVPPCQGTFGAAATSRVGDVLGRWTHTFSPRSDMALQIYFDSIALENFGLEAVVKTGDFDFQHHIGAGQRNDLVWGVGARTQPIVISSSTLAAFNPNRHTDWLASAFGQDEIGISDSFRLTVGVKVERNDITGNNAQPSIRAVWLPTNRTSVWAAVSRALRAPSRQDASVSVNLYAFPSQNGLTDLVSANGNPQIQAESLTAFETGYRYQPTKKVSLDFAAFFNRYTNLMSLDPLPPTLVTDPELYVAIPFQFGNKSWGNTYGLEASATVNVS
jgi:iron complex outermembrane receptor protein